MKYLSVLLVIITCFSAYAQNKEEQPADDILKDPAKQEEIMAAICNDHQMLGNMMEHMMQSEHAMQMMRDMMMNDTALSEMMMDNMMEKMASDSSMCKCCMMMKNNERMKGMMNGMGEGMKGGMMKCPMHGGMQGGEGMNGEEQESHH